MNPPVHKVQRLVWGFLLIITAAIFCAFLWSKLRQRGVNPGKPLSVYGQVADFALTNQLGRRVSLADLRGQVWVADIVFTQCAGPCPIMTQRISELQSAVPASDPVKFITLTTDPDFDTPEVLKRYGEHFHADSNRWWFLTGTKPQIAGLARDSLKLTAIPKDPAEQESEVDLFIHSTIFVIVDKQGRFRGVFESLEPGVQAQIMAAINRLLREK
jgi:protein SCO1/2